MKMWLAKQRARAALMKVFRNGEIGNRYSYGSNSGLVYPKIHSVNINQKEKNLTYVFSIPTGMDPKQIKKKEYCFMQVFGEQIEIKGDTKTFTLRVYLTHSSTLICYDADLFREQANKLRLPIVCGVDMNGAMVLYDMVDHPHLLIAGETGSGKSTQLRSILSSLIQYKSADRLQLFLCDLKRSEFHIFRRVAHVQSVLVSPVDMAVMLAYLSDELTKRGDLLDAHELSHIDDLPEPPPYIVLCIDEVALLRKEKAIMTIVEDISSIGRALGIFLILSMQRPDAKLLEGALKNNLTVRMGFKCTDLINARIIGTPGSEKLKENGRMLLKLQGQDRLKEIQAPYLGLNEAKDILERHKSPVEKKTHMKHVRPIDDDSKMIEAIFEVLD